MTREEEDCAGSMANQLASMYQRGGAFTVDAEEMATMAFNDEMLKLMLKVIKGYGLLFRVTYHATKSRWHVYHPDDYKRWVAMGKPDIPRDEGRAASVPKQARLILQ